VLREINGMPPGSTLIRAGQELRIGPFGDATGEHVVRRGETLSRIASRYGMSVAELRILNGLGNRDNVIHPGQRLRVEATGADAARIHVVRAGETLLRIAVAYGVGLSDLLTHNQLTEASIIHPGQLIRIPGL